MVRQSAQGRQTLGSVGGGWRIGDVLVERSILVLGFAIEADTSRLTFCLPVLDLEIVTVFIMIITKHRTSSLKKKKVQCTSTGLHSSSSAIPIHQSVKETGVC